MKRIELPNGIEQVGYRTFYGCSSLENVYFPKSIKRIEGYAFAECSSLKEISINQDITSIEDTSFKNSPNVIIYGQRESYAESYAERKNIPFVAVNIEE